MSIYNIHTSCIDKGFYTIKCLSEEDFVALNNAVKHLQKVLYEMNLSLMLNQSYNQLIAGLNSNIENVDDRFVYWNFHYSNWLSSFYTWTQFHEYNFNHLFVRLKSKYYDDYAEYKFSYYLRTYLSHKSFVITKHSYDCLNNKTAILICPKELLETDRENVKNKDKVMLESYISQGQEIDAVELATSLYSALKHFQKEIWDGLCADVQESLQLILKNIPMKQPECYNSAIDCDENETHISIGHIVTKFIQLADKLYPPFTENLYY